MANSIGLISDRQDSREQNDGINRTASGLTGLDPASISLLKADRSGNYVVLDEAGIVLGVLVTLDGNLVFFGAGLRLKGDLSNATHASRLQLQSSTVNGNTLVGAIPNGSAGTSAFTAYGASDPDNAAFVQISAQTLAGIVALAASKTGTGTYLPMALQTSGATQVQVETDGSVTLTQGQITFPAVQVPSSDVNTLDDYEEGTWTPTLGGSATYTARSGTYTKIGKAVTIQGHMIVNAIVAGSTTTISGLPFTAGSERYSITVGFWGTTVSSFVYMSGLTIASGTGIEFGSATAATAGLALNAVFKAGTEIFFSGTYFV